MATFTAKPVEGQDPWAATDLAWRASVESAVNTVEGTAGAALPSASFDTRLGTRVKVDNTVGRTASVWDSTNSRWQLIYGDTGIRALELPAELAGATVSKLELSRHTGHVTFGFENLVCSANSVIATLPQGFRNRHPQRYVISLANGSTASLLMMPTGVVTVSQALTTGSPGNFSATWRTTDAWPTVLPGTAVGSIPNA